MLNLFYDSYSILNKVYSEGAFLKQAMIAVPIEEKNRAATTKICYGVLERDILLSYWIKCLCDKNPKLVVRTVLKISMYNIKFLDKAPYAVTDTAVELCNKLGKKGVAGFVNAVLRKFASYNFPEATNKISNLSLKYDYPEFAVKRLLNDYGQARAESIMAAPAERTCVRFSVVNGKEYFSERGVAYEETPYNNVLFAERFHRNSDYDKGVYTFQSIGSIAICDAVEPGGELLDACAAPGGKSVLLSSDFDSVVSQEIHPHRADLIDEYATRMGVNNIKVVVGDAAMCNNSFVGRFDAVLCDVPCSGFGVLKTNPDIKLKKEDSNICELSNLQFSILQNCSKYVKVGGVLYYSTCTLFDAENDDVVGRFLKENPSFLPAIISSKIPYDKRKYGLQYLPDISYGAGFYVSALRRVE